MAKVTCELNNMVLLENANLSYVDGRPNGMSTSVIHPNLANRLSGSPPLACPNGCKNGLHANVNSTSVNSCLTGLPNSHCQPTSSQPNGVQPGGAHLIKPGASRPNSSQLSHLKKDDQARRNLQQQIPNNKTLFNNSIHFDLVKSNRFRDRKADRSFPRKFVNVQKKEYNDDGLLVGTKRVTKTCVLQPSLFENIPPTIYFGLEDELSRFFFFG